MQRSKLAFLNCNLFLKLPTCDPAMPTTHWPLYYLSTITPSVICAEYSTKSLSTMVTSMAGTAGKLDCATPPMGGQHRHNGHGQLHQHKNYQHAHQQQLALGGTYSKTSIGSTTEPSPNASVSNCSVVLVASTTPNNCCSSALNSLTPNSSSTNSQRVKTEAFEMEEFACSEKDSFL